MKYINIYITVYHDNKIITKKPAGYIITNDFEKYQRTDILTWDNISDYYYEHGLLLPFDYYKTKKGKIINFFNYNLFDKSTWSIKQNKHPNLGITVQWSYQENTYYSIEDILKYPDAKIATQFLQERGLK